MTQPRALARGVLRTRGARRGTPRGFSLPELLVVLAIVGLSVAVAIPLVSHELRMVRIRSAADRFASDLRAARMIAVTTRKNVPVHVNVAPDNFYSYTDASGAERRIEMPEGVDIVSTTSDAFFFKSDGSTGRKVITVLRARNSGEQWTVTTSLLGIPATTR